MISDKDKLYEAVLELKVPSFLFRTHVHSLLPDLVLDTLLSPPRDDQSTNRIGAPQIPKGSTGKGEAGPRGVYTGADQLCQE